MKKRTSRFYLAVLLIISLPIWMAAAWQLSTVKKLSVAIINKTYSHRGEPHSSLSWLLRYHKFSKAGNTLYNSQNDYFGFFATSNGKKEFRGPELFNEGQLEKLSNDCDMVYITETYVGPTGEAQSNKGPGFSGISSSEIKFLEMMQRKKKLVVAEFNTFASPTSVENAEAFEKMFEVRWTGWIGKYFESLNPTKNPNLPDWLIQLYKKQNAGKWPFKNAGIAFIRRDFEVVILEHETHLNTPLPLIVTGKQQRERFGVPKAIESSLWFDVIETSRNNSIVSFYHLDINEEGKDRLKASNIPAQFPAVVEHYRNDYKFYYFAGDFANNQVSASGSYFKGIHQFRNVFYRTESASPEITVFWDFYRPMLSKILKDYQRNRK